MERGFTRMTRIKSFKMLMLLLVVLIVIVGCGQIEVGIEMPVAPTSTRMASEVAEQGMPTDEFVTPTLKPTAVETAVVFITYTLTAAPTLTPLATPTSTLPPPPPTPTKTAVPIIPTVTPTATPVLSPEIYSFGVDMQEVEPNSVLNISWSTFGDRIELCVYQSGYSGYYECWPVAATDSLSWQMPEDLSTGFWVEIIAHQGNLQVVDGEFVQVSCANPEEWWFFSPSPTSCPMGEAIETAAAFQYFEHGWMLWLESEDVIYVFFDDGTYAQFYGHHLLGDVNSGDGGIVAPDGRVAPVRGFGLVWRGEAYGAEGGWIRDKMGWGLYPESGFQAHYQKEMLFDTVGRYVTDLDGRVIFMDLARGTWSIYSNAS